MLEILKSTASMTTRDGIRLDADIYRPDSSEDLPILLMRQPYGREIASTVVYAHPRWYASQGYIVVIQDVRGRGTSEGSFDLFTHEIADGFDTITWVSQLPQSTGKVGMYGFSYQGMTQLYAAVEQPSALCAIAPAMVAYDLYTDWAYENGAFCLYANLAWAIQLAGETARLQGNERAYGELLQASQNLPLHEPIPANPEIMQRLAPDSFYHQWLNNCDPQSPYWQQRSPKYLLDGVDLPMLHVGGWFDPYLRGTLNLYQAMADKSQHPQHLLVGPWAHLPWGRRLGALDYGSQAQNPIDEIQIRWFDYFLKGQDTGILTESPICLFDMGAKEWLECDRFGKQQRIYYLASDGLANIRQDGGRLWQYESEISTTEISPRELIETDLTQEIVELDNSVDTIVHDPWRAVPALGGHASYPGGAWERSHIDCRSDIITYTSSPLETELLVLGEIQLELYCRAEQPSFDLCAVLSTVQPDGQVFNFSQGYLTVKDNKPEIRLVKIPLQPICISLQEGHSIRLSLSAACFPAYPINSGTNKPLPESYLIDRQIITISVYSGADYPSLIKLSGVG